MIYLKSKIVKEVNGLICLKCGHIILKQCSQRCQCGSIFVDDANNYAGEGYEKEEAFDYVKVQFFSFEMEEKNLPENRMSKAI